MEVFSNLVKVTDRLWEVFGRPGVRLATSYYSPDAAEHEAVTGRRRHDRTLASIRDAVRRGIPLRVGVIRVADGQHVEAAMSELLALGVTEVEVDRQRQVGRGAVTASPGVDQLCGHCADGSLSGQ